MGYFGKIEEKTRAIELRKKGMSYSEIRKIVPVSKDTISRWCRDVFLSVNQIEELKGKKLAGSERGRLIGSKVLQKRRLDEIDQLNKQGRFQVGSLSERDRFIAGIALYIGDGYKSDKVFGFTNSDPDTIKFMTDWVREFCELPEEKLYGQIWIHDNLDPNKAKKFWSELTGIPESRFQKTYVSKNKPDSLKVRKQVHKYGIFALRASRASVQRLILGWMAGILEAKRLK